MASLEEQRIFEALPLHREKLEGEVAAQEGGEREDEQALIWVAATVRWVGRAAL